MYQLRKAVHHQYDRRHRCLDLLGLPTSTSEAHRMNTQQYLQRLDAISTEELRDEVAKNEAEVQQFTGTPRRLAEYKLHLSREELKRR